MYQRTYHTKVLKQDPAKTPRPFPWKRLLWTMFAVTVVIGVVVLVRAPRFQVAEVHVSGAEVVDPVDISTFVTDSLHGRYLYVLPKTSIFLIPTASLAARIKDTFPRFEAVRISRVGGNTLEVDVTEYAGAYIWCPEESDESECSFMDAQGIVFAPAPHFSGDAYMRLYGGVAARYPFAPLPPGALSRVALLSGRLEAISITPTAFHFVSEHELSVIFVHNGADALIHFDPTRDLDESLSALYSGLRTDPLGSLYHDDRKVLEYIDLRFANKVVYKFQ